MNHVVGRRRIVAAVVSLLGLASLALVTSPAGAEPATSTTSSGPTETYLIVYSNGVSSAGAATAISSAGGTMVASYQQIGVAVARSANPTFADTIAAVRGVEGVSATAPFATPVDAVETDDTVATTAAPSASEPLAGAVGHGEIHAPQAHAITGGNVHLSSATSTRAGLHAPGPGAERSPPRTASSALSGAPHPLQPGNDDNGTAHIRPARSLPHRTERASSASRRT